MRHDDSVAAVAAGEAEQKEVFSLASKYPSAGIQTGDTFDAAQQKIRQSKEYQLDIAKAESDLANTRSLISSRVADSQVDYNDPILTLYTSITKDVIASPSKARGVLGYAEGLLSEKEIVGNDFVGPLADNQIREADAKKLLTDAFTTLNKKKDGEDVPDSTVWSWLSTTEAKDMSDEDKKTTIMQAGKNPEDFGIY